MKKLLLTLFLFIPVFANASEYNQIDSNFDIERRYKYYEVKQNYGPYELEETENKEYPFIDYEKYIYSEYSDWTDELLDKDKIEKTVYKYKVPLDTNKIILADFSNHDFYVDVTGLKVFYKGEEIDYELTCELCEKDFNTKLKNGKARIEVNGKLFLNLDKYYSTKDIDIKLDFISTKDWVTWITVKYLDNEIINLSSRESVSQIIGDASFNIDGEKLDVQNTDKIIYKDIKEENNDFLGEEKRYKYRDKLYQKYNVEKIYTNFLTENPDETKYIKDESLYKDYYITKEIPVVSKINENNNLEEVAGGKNEAVLAFNEDIKTEEVKVVSNIIKTKSNPEKIKESSISSEPLTAIDEEKEASEHNYNFLYWFLIIPFLFLVKIILVLSKQYKNKHKHVNV